MNSYLKDYLKLLKFSKPYIGILALAFLCMGVSTVFEGVSLGMIAPMSDRVLTNKEIVITGKLPHFLVSIVDKLNSIGPMSFLKFIVIFLPLLFLIKGFILFIQEYLMNIVGNGVVKDVRNKLYAKFQDLSMDFYGKSRAGELMSRVTNDVKNISLSISTGFKDLIFESMKVVVFAFLSFYIGFKISWKLPVITFVIFPLIMVPVVRIGKKIKKLSLEGQKKMADLNSLMAETIGGANIVKAFCREDYEIKRFKMINYQYYKFILKGAKRTIALGPLTEFVGVLGAVGIVWIVGKEVISGSISFGVFGVFLAFVMSMVKPLKKLSNVHALNQKALAASERIYSILEEEPQIKEKPEAKSISNFKDTVKFDGVWFRYNEEDDYVLKDINLSVQKGKVIALVGHSGAGKSTLVGLIPRFYDPQKGSICIDGLDIKDVKIKDLRGLISIVSQETTLFNSKVRDNIAYGKEGASMEDIIKAAKKAHAYEFVMNMPNGFETIVGDRGFRLSGGEKQRIAIARAILKNAPILILDEATSQLDSASEQLIKDALYSLMEGRTAFVIAHRLSTVQKADMIVVLEKGKIVESGTHTHLLSQDSLYKKLYELQFNV
jgi:subfamily B ATP-binding cassette protein MsbA